MDRNIFGIIVEYATNEGLNSALLQNDEYKQIQDKINGLTEQIDKFNLPKEQRLIVDRFVSSYIESGCCYGRIAYQQGIKDCALLLREMELIKDGKEEGVV